MNQLRLDPLTGRWVVVSVDRARRPSAFVFSPRVSAVQADTSVPCPFCPGNEGSTPPALETYGPSGRWLVRVVPNLYPAFEGDHAFVVEHRGPVFTQATAGGIHEVLVLSPDHQNAWENVDEEQAGLVMAAIRDRIEEHSTVAGIRYSQAIVNSGREAGASIEHPHAQLLGMSFVPRELAEEQAGFARFTGRCLLCTAIDAEESTGYRVVYSDERGRGGMPVLERHSLRDARHPAQSRTASAPSVARRPGQRRKSPQKQSRLAAGPHRRRALQPGVPLGAIPGT